VPPREGRDSLPGVTTSLNGRSVLVAGATGALGSAIARLLGERGAALTLTGRSQDRLSHLARELAVPALAVDLRDAAGAERAVEVAVAAHERLDGVVHAAGVVAFGPASEVDDATLEELFAVNVLAPVRLVRAAHPHLVASAHEGNDPFVLTISAVVAEQPMAGMAAYSASKAALAAFDAAAGRELRRARIRLVDARPPHTETGLAERPIAGTAPSLPRGLDATAVATRIVEAIENGERDLPSTAFS
jgi:cyclic-di-GMP-binding biofilm dispersal mediator protein